MKLLAYALFLLVLFPDHPLTAGEAVPLSAERTIVLSLEAPVDLACTLFGPVQERSWAPDWNPNFLYRSGPADEPLFAVFTTGDAESLAVWTMTAYEPGRGYIQYVNVRPGRLVTVIDIRCTADGPKRSRAEVMYRKTALTVEANQAIEHFAREFSAEAPHWEKALNDCIRHGANSHYSTETTRQ